MDSINRLCKLVDNAETAEKIKAEYEKNLHLVHYFDQIPTVGIDDIFPNINEQEIKLWRCLGHWGNGSIEALVKLCMIVAYTQPKTIFEIGTFNGLSALNMSLNSEATVYTLDLAENEDAIGVIDNVVAKELLPKFGKSTGSYFKHYPGDIRQLIGNSRTYNFCQFYNSIDLVFIDGGHDYKTKQMDALNSLRMVKRGGLIIFDNIKDETHTEVTKCVYDLGLQIQHIRNTFLGVVRC